MSKQNVNEALSDATEKNFSATSGEREAKEATEAIETTEAATDTEDTERTQAQAQAQAQARSQVQAQAQAQAKLISSVPFSRVNFVNIPGALKSSCSFCVWRKEKRNGKPVKVPYDPKT